MKTKPKPTAADIELAIKNFAARDWIDPIKESLHWYAGIYSLDGGLLIDGRGHTAGQAMAEAWVMFYSCDELLEEYNIDFKSGRTRAERLADIPREIPERWLERFGLTPPWEAPGLAELVSGPDWPVPKKKRPPPEF